MCGRASGPPVEQPQQQTPQPGGFEWDAAEPIRVFHQNASRTKVHTCACTGVTTVYSSAFLRSECSLCARSHEHEGGGGGGDRSWDMGWVRAVVRHPTSQKIAQCSVDCENSKADQVSGKRKAQTSFVRRSSESVSRWSWKFHSRWFVLRP